MTTTQVRIPQVTIPAVAVKHETITVAVPKVKRALRQDLDKAIVNLAHEEAKIENYRRYPALDKDGGPMVLPFARRIALKTVTKRHAAALAAYEARYGKR